MFALCDQRSFYASCECIFRPDLRDKPVTVLSNNDGCVVALNQHAKAHGIEKFTPYFKQRDKINAAGGAVFSSNYTLYGEVSRRIMETLRSEVPRYEVYSIDEGFSDLSGIPYDQLKPFAHHLKHRIWREQRIPMGVSIANTKTLAKIGQFAAKTYPQLKGVCFIQHDHQRTWLLHRTPVKEVWGIGRALSKKLEIMQVRTALDLSQMQLSDARKLFGVCLVRTIHELNGQPCIPLEEQPDPRQNIVCTRSFGQRLTELDDIKIAVANYVARACEKLRKQQLYAGRMSVFLQTSRFDDHPYSREASISLPGGSDDTCRCTSLAIQILEPLFKPGFRYAKAGVGFLDLRPATGWQLDCFTPFESNNHALMKVMDQINQRFEPGSIRTARQGRRARFTMQRELLSPSYLTQWSDIPVVSN